MTHRYSGICDLIRSERRKGNTRCGVVDGVMTVAEIARMFRLADDSRVYKPIGSIQAKDIATRILGSDLVHGSAIMGASRAAELWQGFRTLFEEEDIEFFSNTNGASNSWTPATQATFDMGIIVVGSTRAGCLWVEEED